MIDLKYFLDFVEANKASFVKILSESAKFEVKGILNSEMLLFCMLAKYLDCEEIIESGRARGQSTEIIARYSKKIANNIKFSSIEFDRNSEDVKIAENRLKTFNENLELLYGDSLDLLPNIINQSERRKIILIDGPKGLDALSLAFLCLKNETVKAVCIHDIHKDTNYHRSLAELWPFYYVSDSKKFVDDYSYLDEKCWNEYQKYQEFKNWGPYQRSDKAMKSYGPTLFCLINDINENERIFLLKKIDKKIKRFKILKKTLNILRPLIPNFLKKNSLIKKFTSPLREI
tara:strand:- start:1491 stop:2354 length:864 start_codon:yes stop_codon:yes gene_type:complete